jgi:hypothetical protein
MIETIYSCMRIIISIVPTKKGDKHLVQVMDNDLVVYSETTNTIDQRDELVWQLAETYNALDIEVTNNKQLVAEEDFRFSEIPSIPVLDEEDAEAFFDDHADAVYSRVLEAVEEGVFLGLDEIRLFELNGTDVYLTSERDSWRSGVERAIEYFVKEEQYEKCIVGRQLLSKL